jgi:hypothetical protein
MDSMNSPWRKSTYSGGNGGNCVETGVAGAGRVLVRDTTDPAWPHSAPIVAFTSSAWSDFLASLTQ